MSLYAGLEVASADHSTRVPLWVPEGWTPAGAPNIVASTVLVDVGEPVVGRRTQRIVEALNGSCAL